MKKIFIITSFISCLIFTSCFSSQIESEPKYELKSNQTLLENGLISEYDLRSDFTTYKSPILYNNPGYATAYEDGDFEAGGLLIGMGGGFVKLTAYSVNSHGYALNKTTLVNMTTKERLSFDLPLEFYNYEIVGSSIFGETSLTMIGPKDIANLIRILSNNDEIKFWFEGKLGKSQIFTLEQEYKEELLKLLNFAIELYPSLAHIPTPEEEEEARVRMEQLRKLLFKDVLENE